MSLRSGCRPAAPCKGGIIAFREDFAKMGKRGRGPDWLGQRTGCCFANGPVSEDEGDAGVQAVVVACDALELGIQLAEVEADRLRRGVGVVEDHAVVADTQLN